MKEYMDCIQQIDQKALTLFATPNQTTPALEHYFIPKSIVDDNRRLAVIQQPPKVGEFQSSYE